MELAKKYINLLPGRCGIKSFDQLTDRERALLGIIQTLHDEIEHLKKRDSYYDQVVHNNQSRLDYLQNVKAGEDYEVELTEDIDCQFWS